MFVNTLIVAGWLLAIAVFGLGYYVRDKLTEEKERKRESKRLW